MELAQTSVGQFRLESHMGNYLQCCLEFHRFDSVNISHGAVILTRLFPVVEGCPRQDICGARGPGTVPSFLHGWTLAGESINC